MSSSLIPGLHRLDIVNSCRKPRTASLLTRVGRGAFGAIVGRGAFGALKAAAVLAIAVSIGLVSTGGTYAYLSSSVTTTPGSTVSAGTAALTVGSQSLNWSALAPGQSVTGTFSITNTGDVPLILSATIAATMTPSATANPFTITAANGACPTSGVPSGTLNSTLAAGATTSACLVVTLPANAPSNAQSASARAKE